MPELLIRQMSARPGEQPRSLRLSGRAGPVDEMAWPVEMRGEVEWHNGTGNSTVQLYGSEEGEVEFEFKWESRLLAPGEALLDGMQIADADALEQALADFVRTRTLVFVLWRQRPLVGFLRRHDPHERGFSEYGVTLTFQPTEPPRPVPPSRAHITSPRSLYEDLRDSFEDVIATAERIVTLARSTVDDAAQAVAGVRDGLSRMGAVVDSQDLVARDATGVRRATGEMLSEIVSTSTGALSTLATPGADLAQADDPLAQMRGRRWRDTNAKAYREARARAVLARREYRPESDILGFHEGIEGQTIWGVSWAWYRDRHYLEAGAEAIRRRNRMPSTAVRAGQRLVIPKRAA
jgi:hypothetical protein